MNLYLRTKYFRNKFYHYQSNDPKTLTLSLDVKDAETGILYC